MLRNLCSVILDRFLDWEHAQKENEKLFNQYVFICDTNCVKNIEIDDDYPFVSLGM